MYCRAKIRRKFFDMGNAFISLWVEVRCQYNIVDLQVRSRLLHSQNGAFGYSDYLFCMISNEKLGKSAFSTCSHYHQVYIVLIYKIMNGLLHTFHLYRSSDEYPMCTFFFCYFRQTSLISLVEFHYIPCFFRNSGCVSDTHSTKVRAVYWRDGIE